MSLPKQGTVCWFDLRVKNSDAEQTKSFYKSLLNWDYQPFGEGYQLISLADEPIGGLCSMDDDIIFGNTPVIYFAVDELNPAIEKLKELGAKLLGERVDIDQDHGCFQNFQDPAGNTVALWASK
ncbi:VOC family protein [bacterium]|nr:VOC family protein [bacterium]